MDASKVTKVRIEMSFEVRKERNGKMVLNLNVITLMKDDKRDFY